MPRARKLVRCRFLPYSQVRTGQPPEGVRWIDVSSRGETPLDTLSPFYAHGGLPIPGRPNERADSVEGIWQGLKVIRGKIAPRFFEGGGQKRVGKPLGHQWGDSPRLLDIVEARRKIYIPAYEWMLEQRVDPAVLQQFIDQAFRGVPQYFYDREDNGSIGKDQPLAHASILVAWLNRKIEAELGGE
ncbi:DUF6939 family protein [Anatilimnocola floriformis]|uniref:DUF6939 family protein n=1 Tax=Anatilimnocola floriformis TaxID=2948575 RepID=UPI0020C4D6B4|nr:hypothetical protein [Anatilimnocola floriformis]